jgi:SAM-dependent methyltransferase
MRMPSAPISLGFCNECGHVFNFEFDADLLEYGPGYENSLHCSERFGSYADSLARTLVDRYELRGRDVLEIGCGRGEFLSILCDKGNNRGVGFDPSYSLDGNLARDGAAISIRSERYDRRWSGVPADFVCCRHTLEHIGNPRVFLSEIRYAIGRPDVPVFFEVPNALYTLAEGMWDVIYEHCSYYSLCSLSRVFTEARFEVHELSECFGGQFAAIHARTGAVAKWRRPPALDQLQRLASSLRGSYERKVAEWEDRFRSYERAGQRVIMWGAGAKGTMFLNTLRPRQIDYVVDVNPRKQDKYIAGTAQRIVSPAFLKQHKPDIIIYQNSNYREEIARQAQSIGCASVLVLA